MVLLISTFHMLSRARLSIQEKFTASVSEKKKVKTGKTLSLAFPIRN